MKGQNVELKVLGASHNGLKKRIGVMAMVGHICQSPHLLGSHKQERPRCHYFILGKNSCLHSTTNKEKMTKKKQLSRQTVVDIELLKCWNAGTPRPAC